MKLKYLIITVLLISVKLSSYAQDKTSLDKMFQTSLEKYKANQFEQANAILDFILESDSTYYKAYIGKANISIAKKQYRTAVLNANWALDLNPNDTDALCTKAKAISRTRNVSEAIEIYQSILKKDPKSVAAINGLARIDYQQKRYKEAAKKLNKAIKYQSDHSETLFNLASAYFKLKDYSRAAKYCNKVLKINPTFRDESVYTIRGACNNKLNNPVGAILDYREALKLNPMNPSLYNNIALIFTRQGKYEKAIKYLDASIKIYAKSSVTYYNRGLAYNFLGKHNKAYVDFKKACDLGGYDDACGYYQSLKKKLKK
ncbi:tetratricopeptide repeat protein [Ancylomarina subtilis]|uniref:Tetratricopeptide repeat protein n=1 Tax=Ancylomarina subtilis TaxID=1639035 RepID=A0A4Q7VMG0_9BACT|nr:tetratricopeptide repeat protein [Ancylomarina subtilis]RZT97472.1 tetratricopeptide repeat protein [Ancylomarina subtilis]